MCGPLLARRLSVLFVSLSETDDRGLLGRCGYRLRLMVVAARVATTFPLGAEDVRQARRESQVDPRTARALKSEAGGGFHFVGEFRALHRLEQSFCRWAAVVQDSDAEVRLHPDAVVWGGTEAHLRCDLPSVGAVDV